MWLINTATLQLEFFADASQVRYVALSHTWGEGEIAFRDMPDLSVARSKPGWAKIEMTCRLAQAAEPRIEYAWVDTCCIDKTSSTELSEAINSMFAWYGDSSLCFVYLSDFQSRLGQSAEPEDGQKMLAQSRWFSRGWTLQELIAPRRVQFYDSSWELFGTKQSLRPILNQITGIDNKVLENVACLPSVPVGRRLSWAALRSTSRVEDAAYSLLGIFDVNMPLLYGEGQKAFLRLQEEIAKSRNDLSLFAWQQIESDASRFRGIFAHSPREFLRCRYLKTPLERLQLEVDFAITNRGLRLEKNLSRTELRELDRTNDGLILGLDCVESSAETNFIPKWLGVYLWKHGSTYVRWSPRTLHHSDFRRLRPPPLVSSVHAATVLSPEEIRTMHVQTKILLISKRPVHSPTDGVVVERIVNTRGSFLSYHIFPINTSYGAKIDAEDTTNVAVIYGTQGDPRKRPEDRELWALVYRQGQSPNHFSNNIDDIFLHDVYSHHETERGSAAQDFVFANYSDEEGNIRDDKMPKSVDIADPQVGSKIHRISISVEAEPTMLRFGPSAYNRTFMIMVKHSVITNEERSDRKG